MCRLNESGSFKFRTEKNSGGLILIEWFFLASWFSYADAVSPYVRTFNRYVWIKDPLLNSKALWFFHFRIFNLFFLKNNEYRINPNDFQFGIMLFTNKHIHNCCCLDAYLTNIWYCRTKQEKSRWNSQLMVQYSDRINLKEFDKPLQLPVWKCLLRPSRTIFSSSISKFSVFNNNKRTWIVSNLSVIL